MTATLLIREQAVLVKWLTGVSFRLFKVTIYFHYHDLQPVVVPAALLHRSVWKKRNEKKTKRSCVFYCGRTELALIFIFHTG